MSSPTRSAKGRCGTRAASNEAAGRLLTTTLAAAATAAVPHESRWASAADGPDHVRPSVPRATATPKSPTSTGSPRLCSTRADAHAARDHHRSRGQHPDRRHRKRRGPEGQDQGRHRRHRRQRHREGATGTVGARRREGTGPTVVANERRSATATTTSGDDDRHQPCRRHLAQEARSGQSEMSQHDEVGQVGAGQQQRGGVGEQQAAVEKRCLALAAAAGGVDEDRCEERHRGVEVQEARDHRHQHHGASEEDHATPRQARQQVAGGGEEPALVGHHTHQEQPRHEYEGRPVLGRGRGGIAAVDGDRDAEAEDAGGSQRPRAGTAAREFEFRAGPCSTRSSPLRRRWNPV